MRERQVSSTTHPMTFLMVQSLDHLTGATGLVPVVTISKDGGAFGAAAGAVSEIANGWYALAGNATDRNTLGGFVLHAAVATADPCDRDFDIVKFDPFDPAFGPFKINQAAGFSIRMVQSGDHVTGYTAGSVTGSRTIAGGTSAAVSGTITQVASTNEYYFAGAAADFNGTEVHFKFLATGADPVSVSVNTTP